MEKNLVVDFIAQITDEDVVVARGVFFVVGIALVGPVDLDFRIVDSTTVERVHGTFSCAWVIVLDEAIVETFGLDMSVR